MAAAFLALLLHTMLYAAFLEDPFTWTLLAIGARSRPSTRPSGTRRAVSRAVAAESPPRPESTTARPHLDGENQSDDHGAWLRSFRAMQIHPLARQFATVADSYERGRPEYAPAVLGAFAAELGIGPGEPVLDLGAGTGKLSRALVAFGFDVVAVEPQAPLRRRLAGYVGADRALEGVAEAIPLADASVAAVTVADAFHWFDRARALLEIHRVLMLPAVPLPVHPCPHCRTQIRGDAVHQNGRGEVSAHRLRAAYDAAIWVWQLVSKKRQGLSA